MSESKLNADVIINKYGEHEYLLGTLNRLKDDEFVILKKIEQQQGEDIVNFIDIRCYFKNSKGELVPTRKGVRIPLQSVMELRKILDTVDVCDLDK